MGGVDLEPPPLLKKNRLPNKFCLTKSYAKVACSLDTAAWPRMASCSLRECSQKGPRFKCWGLGAKEVTIVVARAFAKRMTSIRKRHRLLLWSFGNPSEKFV